MAVSSNGDAIGHRSLELRPYPHVLQQLDLVIRQYRCRLLNWYTYCTLFRSSVTSVRYDST